MAEPSTNKRLSTPTNHNKKKPACAQGYSSTTNLGSDSAQFCRFTSPISVKFEVLLLARSATVGSFRVENGLSASNSELSATERFKLTNMAAVVQPKCNVHCHATRGEAVAGLPACAYENDLTVPANTDKHEHADEALVSIKRRPEGRTPTTTETSWRSIKVRTQ